LNISSHISLVYFVINPLMHLYISFWRSCWIYFRSLIVLYSLCFSLTEVFLLQHRHHSLFILFVVDERVPCALVQNVRESKRVFLHYMIINSTLGRGAYTRCTNSKQVSGVHIRIKEYSNKYVNSIFLLRFSFTKPCCQIWSLAYSYMCIVCIFICW